jgi:thiamine kinase-like enzyme
MESWFKNLGASPFTLTHGDFRPDNFAFHENGDVVLFDWQTARRGANTRDLSYFISFALPTALRRAHEGELLDLYHRTLVDNGVSDYTMDQLQKDFRRSIGSALMVGVIAGTLLDFSSERAVQLQRVLCERVSAVVKDHDFAEWLPAYLGIGSGEA